MIGDKIKLGEEIESDGIKFKKGHIFKVIGESHRGLDIEDDQGNKIYECRFIQHTFILYTLKEERKDKLNKINEL